MSGAGRVAGHSAVLAGWAGGGGTSELARGHVEALVSGFDEYLWRFEASGLFTGPSIHFHERAIQRRRGHGSAASLLADDLFLEYVYAVLSAWGTQRMDAYPARVTEFSLFAASLRSVAPAIARLWPLGLMTLAPENVPAVSRSLWQVIASIRASAPETRIAAGSVALHHVLPDLIPPIDRQYTLRFFAGQDTHLLCAERAFLEWFPHLVEIGHRCSGAIGAAVSRAGYMASGPAKVIDNAIIGFVETHDSQPYAW